MNTNKQSTSLHIFFFILVFCLLGNITAIAEIMIQGLPPSPAQPTNDWTFYNGKLANINATLIPNTHVGWYQFGMSTEEVIIIDPKECCFMEKSGHEPVYNPIQSSYIFTWQLKIRLPSWQGETEAGQISIYGGPCPTALTEWNNWLDDIRKHEYGHDNIVRSVFTYSNIKNAFSNVDRDSDDCVEDDMYPKMSKIVRADISIQLSIKLADILMSLNNQQDNYDSSSTLSGPLNTSADCP